MDETWTLPELVTEAASRIAALPPPKNGQIRAVPDERTIRYYATLGLLDRPSAMRGRTALYGPRHLAQVVAIKRMQSADKSLAEIQALWPTLDDGTLARMTGVEVKGRAPRKEFWKGGPRASGLGPQEKPAPLSPDARGRKPEAAIELHIELAPNIALTIAVPEDGALSLAPADLRALRAATASLVAELAKRGLIAPSLGTLEES